MGVKLPQPSLRVANIIEEGRYGGPQKRIVQVASGLREKGIESVVFLPGEESDRFCRELEFAGVAYRAINIHRLGRQWRMWMVFILTFFSDVKAICRVLRQEKYDVVHVSGGSWQFKGIVAARLLGLPVLWHLNDSKMVPEALGLFRLIARWLAAGFLVTAHRVYQYYIKGTPLEKKPAYFVQAPVDTVKYDRERTVPDKDIMAYSGIKIVSVANINPTKGIENLIRAAALLLDRKVDFNVFVIGPVYQSQQDYFSSLKKRISSSNLMERFHFVGPHENVPAALAAADIFVCSSIAEAGPMTVWEAMAMKCAIVSTDVGDVARYIVNNESGYLVPVNDEIAMADAIYQLTCMPQLRAAFGEKARKAACDSLDIKFAVNETARAYTGIINHSVDSSSANRLDYLKNGSGNPEPMVSLKPAGNARILGVDASNIRAGGGVSHLIQLLGAADPSSYGFDQVIVWAGRNTLDKLPDRPWLFKLYENCLDKGLLYRTFWQRYLLPERLKQQHCSMLWVPGGTAYRVPVPLVSMSQNLLPFSTGELLRYGVSWMTLKLLLLRRSQSRTFSSSQGVIFLSKYSKNSVLGFVKKPPRMMDIIASGIDIRFLQNPRPARPLEECSLENPIKLLYVSIVDAYKHQWVIAEAVASLRSEGIPVELELVGAAYPPSKKRLDAVLDRMDPQRKFIRYRSAVDFNAIHTIYRNADIGIFASSCETFPLILLETMAAGLPIACSNREPMPEIIGDACIYFDPEDVHSVANALRKLMVSTYLRNEISRASFHKVQEYSWARCANETFGFLRDVLDDCMATESKKAGSFCLNENQGQQL